MKKQHNVLLQQIPKKYRKRACFMKNVGEGKIEKAFVIKDDTIILFQSNGKQYRIPNVLEEVSDSQYGNDYLKIGQQLFYQNKRIKGVPECTKLMVKGQFALCKNTTEGVYLLGNGKLLKRKNERLPIYIKYWKNKTFTELAQDFGIWKCGAVTRIQLNGNTFFYNGNGILYSEGRSHKANRMSEYFYSLPI